MASRGEFFARPWDSQPQEAVGVDWGNPITRGLKVLTLGGQRANSVDGRQPSRFVGITPQVRPSGYNWVGSAGSIAWETPLVSGVASIFSISQYSASNVRYGGWFRRSTRSGIFLSYEAGAWKFFNQDGFNAAAQVASPVSGRAYALLGVEEGSRRTLYVDGAFAAQDTSTRSLVDLQNAGPYYEDGGSFFDDLTDSGAIFAAWDRALSADESRRLYENPWQLFAPRRIWVPVAAAGGGGTQSLTATRFDNAPSFYAATVTPGAVTLAPALFTNTPTFYAATVANVAPGAQGLTASLFSNSPAFYGHTVAPGAVTVSAGLFTSGTGAFYAATVARGAVTLTPARFDNAAAFYGPTVTTGAVTLTATRFDNSSTFYAATVAGTGPGLQTLTAGLFSNTASFYAPTLTTGGTTLTASRFDNTSTFYAATVGAITLTTGSVVYIPIRALTGLWTTAIPAESDLANLRAWLPPQRVQLVDSNGVMRAEWYRFFHFLAEKKLGGATSPTIPEIATSLTSAVDQSASASLATASLTQQVAQNADSLDVTVQVARNNNLTGAGSIPPVQRSTQQSQ